MGRRQHRRVIHSVNGSPKVAAETAARSVYFQASARRVGKPCARKASAAASRSASTQGVRAPGRRVRSPS
jgi:hypothetical protein